MGKSNPLNKPLTYEDITELAGKYEDLEITPRLLIMLNLF